MADTLLTRIRNAWNVFRYGDDLRYSPNLGVGYGYRPDRLRMLITTERSIIASVYNRIGIDVSSIRIRHVRVDENEAYQEDLNTGLNNCLNVEANLDQSARAFIQDVVMSMCDEGVVAIVPVDTTLSPAVTGSYDVLTMRTGRIIQWYPEHVQVNVYNQRTGLHQDIIIPKTMVAIVENPLYAVMNEPNSVLKRLIDKLNLLDAIDKQSGSGKLDLLIQLPYAIKTETRRKQADNRRDLIEQQLQDSKYGIAYVDGTEKVTQLNRPAENNLMAQIEYLTRMLYSQLGMTEEVFEGTADELTMINYYNRTIEPMLSAITAAMSRVFITKTGRSQGQRLIAIRDPFKLVSAEVVAEMADKFTRNEILSSNEFRAIIGLRPSDDPKADELRNKNLNQQDVKVEEPVPVMDGSKKNGNNQNGRSS
ncbi:phage portal protein [Candidatus Bathyarchaeota archaeon]|nr:phage portal protein [Candidatus Bathyarchaeota archaeon]